MKKITCLLIVCSVLIANSNQVQAQNENGVIDLNNLDDYLNYYVPDPILNSDRPVAETPASNPLNNETTTLGRVLFYDKNLSVNNTVSCASCHKQEFAFGDTAIVSQGWNGEFTTRHSPKLINLNFAEKREVFWDISDTLENQPIKTISNPIEMGFSGTNGQPDISALYTKLTAVEYYPTLFEFAFGDATISQERINFALAQFVRSIVSFDTKYDEGLQTADSPDSDFPNFTEQENRGKKMVSTSTVDVLNDKLGCERCHIVPTFNISEFHIGHNGIFGVPGDPDGIDVFGWKPPALRELVNPNGMMNGPLMHDGSIPDIKAMIEHYDSIPEDAGNIGFFSVLLREDPPPTGRPQVLNLDEDQKLALEAFFKTLTGSDVYTNPKWSDPFNEDGTLTLIPKCDNSQEVSITGLPASVTTNDPPISLNANPEGGTFNGSGVTFNVFNPASVLPGFHQINYTYLNGEGCSIEVSETILVATVTYNFVTYNLGTISPKIIADLEIFEDSQLPITVSDLNGRILFETNQWFTKGKHQFIIDADDWLKGICLIKVGQHNKPEKVYIY